VALVEDVTKPVEEAVDPVVGLVRIMLEDAERDALVVAHSVEHTSNFDQVRSMVTGQRVELTGDEQGAHTYRAGPADVGINQGRKHPYHSRAVHNLAGDLEVGT
jgi:hypothetical protein